MGIDINQLSPQAQRQIAQKLAAQARKSTPEPRQGKSKYHNTPAERNGESENIRFSSQKEARRYDELMLMLKAGEIRDLRLQPQFTLQEAYTTPDGKRVRAIRYVADFSYERMRPYWKGYEAHCPDDGWYRVVEDTKGGKATQTAIYKMKKKMMQDKYGITIKEV